MVHVADNSLYGYGYREINQQLAKDNGELRQQLSLALQENSQQRIELHRRDVELIELRREVQELKQFQDRYEAIKKIVTNDQRKSIESICCPGTHPQSKFLTSKDVDDVDDDESVHDQALPTSTTQQSDQSLYLQPIPEEDSLDPGDVTSVPPITHDDRSIATPSIWNCLDTLAPEPSPVKESSPINLKAMFESTPVQPPSTLGLAAQARQMRTSDREFQGQQQQPQQKQQQQQQQPQQQQEQQQQQQPVRYNLRKRTKR